MQINCVAVGAEPKASHKELHGAAFMWIQRLHYAIDKKICNNFGTGGWSTSMAEILHVE
jgi:hypothetical protein